MNTPAFEGLNLAEYFKKEKWCKFDNCKQIMKTYNVCIQQNKSVIPMNYNLSNNKLCTETIYKYHKLGCAKHNHNNK